VHKICTLKLNDEQDTEYLYAFTLHDILTERIVLKTTSIDLTSFYSYSIESRILDM